MPKVSELIRKKVSYINIRGVHVIFIQLPVEPTSCSEKFPDNPEEQKELSTEKEGEL